MMANARLASLHALERCQRDGAWSVPVLDRLLKDSGLSRQDGAFAVNLTLGVLQNSSYLDHYIDWARGSGKLEPKVRDILRLGAYQLFFLDRIPDHAAVSESVVLCRVCGLDRAAGLVNAVLRSLAAKKDDLPEIPGRGTASYLSVRYTQPLWLAQRLIAQRGYDFSESFFRACNEAPPTDLQINTRKTSLSAYLNLLTEQGIQAVRAAFPEDCLSIAGGRVGDLPGFGDGLFYVQDRAAAMAVTIAGPKHGMKVLDACAAPGGKSFAAALRMEDRGEILSCDIHEKKLSLIRDGAERLGITCIRTKTQDARSFVEEWSGAFDLVIADVPCSGFGVMRKKPEIRFRPEAESKRLPEIQRAILDNLSSYLSPGGTLLYSTCTVLKEENEEVVDAFLQSHSGFVPVDFEIEGRRSSGGCYTFWPHIDGTDGFFAAILKRIET